MIDLKDPFYGLLFALLILLAFAIYIAFFTKLEESPKNSSKSRR